MNQFELLGERRFWPLFWTQFLGAFNDNLFKTFLTLMVTYEAINLAGVNKDLLVPLAAGIFILPFFLFSATAGQLSDRLRKSDVMRVVKLVEIGIMACAALGFYSQNVVLLLIVLFLMGLQSTFFGPAKYSIIPELLPPGRLVAGNSLIEMGTFLAILLGTVVAGFGVELADLDSGGAPNLGATIGIGAFLIIVAVVGFATSRQIPKTPTGESDIKVGLEPFRPTWRILKQTASNPAVFRAVLGISWFWFFGATILSLLQLYVSGTLHGSSAVTTAFLALFCLGIGAGSFACERLSKGRLEIGLVPLGSIGMTLFTADLFFARGALEGVTGAVEPFSLALFIQSVHHWRIMGDFFAIAFFGGLFTVPLYTMVQERTEPSIRSRVIAGMNILNAAFMVVAAVGLMLLGLFEVDHYTTFLILAGLTALVSIYIYTLVPEFLLRFVAWSLTTLMYRVQTKGVEHIPTAGGALLLCNNVSVVDWMVISSIAPRPVRFVLGDGYFSSRFWRFVFGDANMIRWRRDHDIGERAGQNEESPNTAIDERHPHDRRSVIDSVVGGLAAGELVCVFPEGRLTRTGEVAPFDDLIGDIIRQAQSAGHLVPVVPMALGGMWGSTFSRKYGRPSRRPFRRFWAEVQLTIGVEVADSALAPTTLREQVRQLTRVGHVRRGGPLRVMLAGLCHLIIRIFFRRVEVIGIDTLPSDGGLIFAANHPNGLVDPLLLFVSTPRWVSFLTKATLFQTPVVSLFVKSFDALPVYRAQDGADPKRNAETICRARDILGGGGGIAIFPEGTSHSDPKLKRLKTGAARMALGAAAVDAEAGSSTPVYIVPVGLYYTAKGRFRSSAAVLFGEAIRVAETVLGEDFEPGRLVAQELTAEVGRGIEQVTVQAESVELLQMATAAEQILADDRSHTFAEAVEIRQQIIDGHALLRHIDDQRLGRLIQRIRSYEAERQALGVSRGLARTARVSWLLAWCLLLALPALLGILSHYPTYRAIGFIARRLAGKNDDTLSSMKVLGALVLLPLTWSGLAAAVAWLSGWTAAGVAVALLPLCGYAALVFAERTATLFAGWRIAWLTLRRRSAVEDLHHQRQEIAVELRALREELELHPG